MAAATAPIESIGNFQGRSLPVTMASNVTIYGGTFVCYDSSGNANPGADTSGFIFAGMAAGTVTYVNPSGGSQTVDVELAAMLPQRLLIIQAANISGTASASWIGTHVFVKDSQTVAQSAGSTNKVIVGTVVGLIGTAIVVDTGNRSALANS